MTEKENFILDDDTQPAQKKGWVARLKDKYEENKERRYQNKLEGYKKGQVLEEGRLGLEKIRTQRESLRQQQARERLKTQREKFQFQESRQKSMGPMPNPFGITGLGGTAPGKKTRMQEFPRIDPFNPFASTQPQSQNKRKRSRGRPKKKKNRQPIIIYR